MVQAVDKERRVWMIACGVAGGASTLGMATALLSTLAPSEQALMAAQPVEVDVADLQIGQAKTVAWRGKPIWIIRRSPAMLDGLSSSGLHLNDPLSLHRPEELTPLYARNPHRSIKPEFLVAVGICSHLGCAPIARFQPAPQPDLPSDWKGGFLCPCHGSLFDLAGRVYANKPAPDNLEIPPHRYVSDTRILIGEA